MFDETRVLEINPDYEELNIKNKTVLGFYEYVKIGDKKVLARIDSGAVHSSIDLSFATSLDLGPVIGSKVVRNVHGSNERPIVEMNMILCKRDIKTKFTLQSRKTMNFKVLIGQNVLKKGFIIDPNKTILKKVNK